MTKVNARISKLIDAFIFAANAYNDFEKRTHLKKTQKGEQLYRAEIHMISEIKENEGIYMTALAEKLNVTIGAVSQTLMKLEKKGLVTKEKDSCNQSRYLLRLTPEGEMVHINHMKFHEIFDNALIEIIGGETDEQLDFLINSLTALRKKILDL